MKEEKFDTRMVALDILTEVFEKDGFCNKVTDEVLKRYPGMTKQDKSFITRLCLGTVERQITIDTIIESMSKTPFKKLKPLIRNVLRMTVYQIMYMDTSDYAACDEAVRIVKKRGLVGLSGFVNAISRNVSREKEVLPRIPDDADDITKLSIRYSVPRFIIERWEPYMSKEDMQTAFEYFLGENRTTVRCNESRTSPEELEKNLKALGIDVTRGECTPGCFKISGFDTMLSVKPFFDGECQVQDESSSLVGRIAGIKAGDTVLDVCAAPGGKTIHAADILRKLEKDGDIHGRVISCDISDRKLSKIKENVLRCGFDNIEVLINDAEEYNEDFDSMADVVIADIPCSGLGIIGKKPDIKYRTDAQKIEELVLLQRRMLRTVAKYVKPGGTLIFSTCTVSRKENEDNVSFICRETGMKTVSLDEYIPEKLKTASTAAGMLQLLPGKFGTDGFFIAKFKREQ